MRHWCRDNLTVQRSGPGGVMFASCPIASITRSQTATPPNEDRASPHRWTLGNGREDRAAADRLLPELRALG